MTPADNTSSSAFCPFQGPFARGLAFAVLSAGVVVATATAAHALAESRETAEPYQVTTRLPDEWVYRPQTTSFDHMFRSKR